MGTPQKQPRKAVFVEGGIHAREWLSPATVIFVIDHFIKNYETDEEIEKLLNNYEIYFVPSTNPDGYEYSRTSESK